MDTASTPRQTPLHARHVALGARMMPFAGFDMPVQYTGIIDEHMAVRQAAGLFDVSHMGEVFVRGPHAFDFVQQLVTNDAARLFDGRCMYTVMCWPHGGIVDDLLVYRLAEGAYLLVINAANIAKDYDWMVQNNPMKADLENVSDGIGLLAIQGPRALEIVERLTDLPLRNIPYYHFLRAPAGAFMGCDFAILSHTGYTGEPGLEIYCEADRVAAVWDALLDAGAEAGLKPAGLGARDTLRVEAGYCLYGNDITDDTNPLEAGLGWLTRLEKEAFVGRDALLRVKAEGPRRRLVGFVAEERGIPRHDYPLVDADGREIGVVTSGTQSPVLQKGVGLGYVPNEAAFTTPGSRVAFSVRGRAQGAVVTKPPFHKK
jgi:aminomethyltransferase